MTFKLARSSIEAHLYMQTVPCEVCGETDFDPDSSVLSIDGQLVSRYSGACPRCGTVREFTFRLPDEILFPDDEEPEFGDERRSELLDPGDWLWLADMFAGEAPATPDGLDVEERRGALVDLRMAAAAVGEVRKFVPHGADSVPADAFFSERGRAVYAREPGRFQDGRLAVVQRTYRDISDRFVADRSV